MNEEWRAIAEFSGYWVSNQGRVASLKHREPRIMTLYTRPDGYVTVTFNLSQTQRFTRGVHRLVAEAFHGPRQNGMEVRHLDGDKTNNAAANLAWGTKSENSLDSVRHGVHPMSRKTQCLRGNEFGGIDHKGARTCSSCKRYRAQRQQSRVQQRCAS